MVKKRLFIDPSPSYSYHAAGEDARARMRHQDLLQDYQDLIKETKAKKKQLLRAKQKKLKLFAEVKFLRRKLKSLGDNSLEIPLKLKKESYRVVPPSPEYEQMDNSGLPSEAHVDDRNYKIAEAATRGTSALSDLNQVSNRSASPSMRYAQMFNSGLPSNSFSVDRNHKAIGAAARGTTALLNLNRASNRSTPPSMSNYAQMHNLGLPPKAPPIDRNHKVTEGATRGTSTLSDLNQVSYRPAPLSSRYSHMHNSGLPPKVPQADRNHKETAALFDLNQVSYRVAPPSIRYAHNSGLPSKAHSVVGNHKLTQAAVPGKAILLDLNLDAEELEEQESLRIDNLKRFSVGGSAKVNDHKWLLRRVGGNERNQLPLRV